MPIVNLLYMDFLDEDFVSPRFEDLRAERDYYRHPANVPRAAGTVLRRPDVVGPSGASRIGYVTRRHPSYASSERTLVWC